MGLEDVKKGELKLASEVITEIEGDVIFTLAEAAEFLGLAPKTLLNKKWRGGGPRCVKRGKRLFYRKSDCLAWHEQQSVVFEPVRVK